MADATVWEWSDTPDDNANLAGQDMYEGMIPAQLNNSIRSIMAALHHDFVSTETGITAAASGLFADAYALTKAVSRVTVSAGALDSVKLLARPVATAYGIRQYVFNDGANSIAVFPGAATDTIDGGAAGAAVPLSAGKRCMYEMITPGVWISAQLGVVSA